MAGILKNSEVARYIQTCVSLGLMLVVIVLRDQ
jgi:hypothetical protein